MRIFIIISDKLGSCKVNFCISLSFVYKICCRVTKKIKHLRRISELSFPDEEEAIQLADDPILDYCKNFPLKDFVHGKVIGEGEFGLVQKSTLVDGTARWDVALKTVKDRDALVRTKNLFS